jgi:MFS superfamily sulfate permease-like transporter
MAQENVTGLNEWGKFLNHYAIIRIVPGIIGGIIIYGAVRTIRHMSVLPSCIVLLMLAFYSVLWATNTSVDEATSNGWINQSAESENWRNTWDFLSLNKVVWSVLPSQIGTLLAMISVVALSSSLDVAAIEIELKRPLDYNHELSTVGLSNVFSGLTGGYTGSYIFSQTIFSLRMGIRSRLMGYVIALLSIVAVVIPFNILSFIPNMFFGSLLMLICFDLMFEWLIDVRSKMTAAEYKVVLTTFGLLQVLGVEFGILAGVIFYFILKKIGCAVGS